MCISYGPSSEYILIPCIFVSVGAPEEGQEIGSLILSVGTIQPITCGDIGQYIENLLIGEIKKKSDIFCVITESHKAILLR